MAIENKISSFLNKRTWIIPLLFGFMCLCAVLAIVGIELKGIQNLSNTATFNVASELCAILVSVMLTLSILPAYKRQSGYIRVFVSLVAALCFTMTCDLAEALVDGIPELIILNKILCILTYTNEIGTMFFFWVYVTYALDSKGKTITIVNAIASALFAIFVGLAIANIFTPIYFSIDDAGLYHRADGTWFISRIFSLYVALATLIAIILSKANLRSKIIIAVFIGLPSISLVSREIQVGTAIQYAAMMVSVVLIFAFIFADNEKDLFSTNKELGIATNIQKHMLPCTFPAFPERKEFDIYASMNPAKEVGGDFYDFFLIDENHLGIVMADVSDKGVPAALFMMASKIMVKNYAMNSLSPKEVITRVNRQICSNNQDEMFVTIWFGILDLKTGILTASNAGHEKPMIKMANGHFEMIKDKHGFVVGWDPDMVYNEYQIQLDKGAKVFVYTDGVPEATNASEAFGRPRTVETLRKYEDLSPQEILANLTKELDAFVGSNDQFDDITMLCVEYKGPSDDNVLSTYSFKANPTEIEKGIKPIITKLEEVGANENLIYKINLALDELFTNICSYAYPNGEGDIIVKYCLNKSPNEIEIEIIDSGKEFNPLESKEPDLTADASKRQIGGLGLFIVKKTMDRISYRRENNQNVLSIKKKL